MQAAPHSKGAADVTVSGGSSKRACSRAFQLHCQTAGTMSGLCSMVVPCVSRRNRPSLQSCCR